MAVNREGSYSALADRIQSALGDDWKVIRQFRDFDDKALPHPAACVISRTQTAHQQAPAPTIWHLQALVYAYVTTKNPLEVADTKINAAIDAVEAAMKLQIGETSDDAHTTLGGVVRRAWVELVEIYQGLSNSHSVAVFTISMLAV